MHTPRASEGAYALPFFLLLTSYAIVAGAQGENCHISHQSLSYDLSRLGGMHFVQRDRSSPPTMMSDILEFSICGELEQKGDVASGDQCPAGTIACLTTVNKKDTESPAERVVAVIPVAQTSHKPDYTARSEPKGIRITRSGAIWPNADGQQQSLVLDLQCTPGEEGQPVFVSYDDKTATVEWKHEAACGFQNSPSDEEKPSSGESVGSGLGWFFLVLILAFVGYFALGAYYNYATYGATGFDLIPHRDFWREVPYMLQDVVSHLCSSFRPRHSSSRGGYIAV